MKIIIGIIMLIPPIFLLCWFAHREKQLKALLAGIASILVLITWVTTALYLIGMRG